MNAKPTLLTQVLMERRTDTARELASSDLAIESTWRPTDQAPVAHEGWLRANGYAPNRRTR